MRLRTRAGARPKDIAAHGAQRARSQTGLAAVLLLLLAALASGTPAAAYEQSRFQIHGFFETQIRTIARDFDTSDGWDLTQWYNVLNLEMELEIAPKGFGPFDAISGFARVEARYDCVWTRGCGILQSADTYGNKSGRLPGRLGDGRNSGFDGTLRNGDTRLSSNIELQRIDFRFRDDPDTEPRASELFNVVFQPFFPEAFPDFTDQSALFWMQNDLDCRFGSRRIKGSTNGTGRQDLVMDPDCKVHNIGRTATLPNPFNAAETSPVSQMPGHGALPFRPVPLLTADVDAPLYFARGGHVPNRGLAQLVRDDDFDNIDQNFRQNELAWNRGASQQDEKELKEIYLDLDLFEGRLWLRVGKQNIVWGKTELFRTTDQFNPQDLGLASLPSLEESRIGLWAARGTWSFYDVGPLQDLRLELAANIDQFQPADFGRCGEPYSPLPACNITFGSLAHGYFGTGLAGTVKPPDPWNSIRGVEVGGRVEFRYDRFSFALTNFYGYNDTPYIDKIFSYERNVDPLTGRPRALNLRGSCTTGLEPACLRAVPLGFSTDADGDGDVDQDDLDIAVPNNALSFHSVNQTLFAFVCATDLTTFGDVFSPANDASGCSVNTPNSRALADPPLTRVGTGVSVILAGQGAGVLFHNALLAPYVAPTNLRPLVADPGDGGPSAPTGDLFTDTYLPFGLSPFLTDEQEALLGCGAFYGTSCDVEGIDLMNGEASVLYQSFPGFEGTFGEWDTAVGIQPGTVGFEGGPVCTRYEDGQLHVLPGCKAPGDVGYDVLADGSTGGALHPFTGQPFASEMAILSWNFLMLQVANSPAHDGTPAPDVDDFDPNDPFRLDGCSFRKPALCRGVRSTMGIMLNVGRPSVRAAGNGRYGRRSFIWHAGTPVALRYDKRNVLGFSMDWAEDYTKSNWSVEASWFGSRNFTDNDELDGLSEADTYNMTVSVDRPTFVNFLNQNRTLLINSQWFFQYVDGYRQGFTSNGPWNVLATLTVATGYFQDRLLPVTTFVYDFGSNSGAFLPQVTYRFTENFSASFGAALFYGRFQAKKGELNPLVPSNRVGAGRDKSFVENGLSLVRERDELFLRIRYTF